MMMPEQQDQAINDLKRIEATELRFYKHLAKMNMSIEDRSEIVFAFEEMVSIAKFNL